MRGRLTQVDTRRKVVCLVLLCFSIYTVSYVGRLNYSAALAEMLATGLLSKTQGGSVATAYFLCYGAGQMVNGFLADRYHPVGQVTLGVAGSVLLNLLMSQAESYVPMLVIWGTNGYFQSLIWAPVFLIVSQSVPEKWRAPSLLVLNTASSAGAVAAYGFSSLVLWHAPWRSVFSRAAVCMGVVAVVWMVGCKLVYRGAVPPPAPSRSAPQQKSGGSFLRTLAFSGGVLLILPAMIHGMLKDGITTWLPTYMTEVFSMPSQMAVAVSIFLPLINMLGATAAYWLMRTLKNEIVCVTLLFGVAGGGLLVLWWVGAVNPGLTILLFSLVTAAMMAANVLFCSEIPVRFAHLGKAATVSGFYNSCGYLGTAASMYVVAYVSQRFGWNVTQLLWISACVGATLCCAAALPKWKIFLASRQQELMKRNQPDVSKGEMV